MSEIITVFFGSIILASMSILTHLISAYHPYHRPSPSRTIISGHYVSGRACPLADKQ